ncbi:hypothetical protein GPZ77_34490 (plasmid) [Streptomyces sp. QHH-9511]|uniref:hypothetical protein n=1 Tax=Streptomyces sp. QHH-9511 TaxID=2684468 RepID=UPI00131648F7|nr:hypothetical protein [Streptomyces sp. QHH-9511]QGZ53341.1 hypothetical protein GPZ77_34490 [Streptomyces sp. QHH-9511]
MTAQRGGDTPDPLLIAEIEDYFARLDPLDLLDDVLASKNPDGAAAAYQQLVTRDWDGEE